MTATSSRTRIVAFAVIVGVALAVAVAAVVLGAGGKHPVAASAGHAVPVSRALVDAPHIVFRDTSRGAGYGRVAIVPLDDPAARPAITGLTCDRVYVAGGRGLCLRAGRGVITTYRGIIFDGRTFREQRSFSLPGNPSRARVSADGRLVAYTVFVTGDGYNADRVLDAHVHPRHRHRARARPARALHHAPRRAHHSRGRLQLLGRHVRP